MTNFTNKDHVLWISALDDTVQVFYDAVPSSMMQKYMRDKYKRIKCLYFLVGVADSILMNSQNEDSDEAVKEKRQWIGMYLKKEFGYSDNELSNISTVMYSSRDMPELYYEVLNDQLGYNSQEMFALIILGGNSVRKLLSNQINDSEKVKIVNVLNSILEYDPKT